MPAPGSRAGEPGWHQRYLDDIGFTLISLLAGFVIVSTIDLNAPGWLVAVIAAAGTAGGIQFMKQVKLRLGGDAGPPGPPGSKPDSTVSAREQVPERQRR